MSPEGAIDLVAEPGESSAGRTQGEHNGSCHYAHAKEDPYERLSNA